MAIRNSAQGPAAIILLAVCLPFTALLAYAFWTRRSRTDFAILLAFAIVRTAAQVCAIGLSVAGLYHPGWLTAYHLCGAEGFFVLAIAQASLLARHQVRCFGRSWLWPRAPEGCTGCRGLRHAFKAPLLWLQIALPAGNGLAAAGSSLTASAGSVELGTLGTQGYASAPGVGAGRACRAAGQAVFLAVAIFSAAASAHGLVRARERQRHCPSVSTLPFLLLAAASPCLVLRGAFSVFSAVSLRWSYWNPNNYTEHGPVGRLVAAEYCLGTVPELVSACLLFRVAWLATERRDRETDDDEVKRETGEAVATATDALLFMVPL